MLVSAWALSAYENKYNQIYSIHLFVHIVHCLTPNISKWYIFQILSLSDANFWTLQKYELQA